MLGGLLIAAGGALLAIVGGLLAALLGVFSGLFFVGRVVGLLTFVAGILMIVAPSAHALWGILAIVFAFASWPFAFGGFIVGFLLALIGGILSIAWHPPSHRGVITVEGRVVGPPAR